MLLAVYDSIQRVSMTKKQLEIIYQRALHSAEAIYDRVIRRWGNVHFARSCVYDWVWSEDFLELGYGLDERELGLLRIQVLDDFHVKPWPWYPVARRIGNPSTEY